MDENKLVVKHAAEDQRMNGVLRPFHPCKQIIHQLRHEPCGRSHKDTLVSVENTLFTAAEATGLLHNILGHDTVEPCQTLDAVRVDLGKCIIGGVCVFDFLDLLLFTQNCFAVDNISDLPQRKRVCLNSQG